MHRRRIGFNFICDAPDFDRNRALTLCDRLRPRWIVVINGLDFAKEVARRWSEINVMVRWVTQDNDPRKSWPSPRDFITFAQREIGNERLYANVGNEAGFSDEVLRYYCDVIDQSGSLRLAVGGFSAGTPEPQDWKRPQALELLKRLDAQRNRVVLNLHEYCGGIITSGMSNPPRFIQPETWPRDLSTITCWHVGRYRFLLNACRDLKIAVPRIVIGEFGHDDMSDIKPWLETLIKTPPYANIRGWKTLRNQNAAWFGNRGWSSERALFEQYVYANEFIYVGDEVEGICDFAECSQRSEWEGFDKSQTNELPTLLAEYANSENSQPDVPTPPASLPKPGLYTITVPPPFLNLRETPGGTDIGDVKTGDVVEVIEAEARLAPPSPYWWLRVALPEKQQRGWIAWLDGVAFTPYAEPPAPTFALTAEQAAWLVQMRDTLDAIIAAWLVQT